MMRYSSLVIGILIALSGTKTAWSNETIAANKPAGVVDFDLDSLKSLGYGSEVADFFKNGNQFYPGQHDVVINVNGAGSYAATVTTGDHGQLCVTPELLKQLRLKTVPLEPGCTTLNDILPAVKVTPHPSRFAIDVVVPEDAFDDQLRGSNLTSGGFALMNNYRIYGMRMQNRDSQQFYQGQFETGMNLRNWVLRNNSSFTSGKDSTKYEFNETTLGRAIEPLKSILQMGQINTQGAQFGGTPLNGLQLYSDSSLQESGRLLVPVTGLTETPATVEISQNGRLLYRTLVPAGPFQLDRVNGVIGGQPLDVSILQNDGRTQRFQVTTSPLDKNARGEMNYQLALGTYRDRSSSSDSDKPLIASAEGDISIGQAQFAGGALFSSPYQAASSRVNLYWLGDRSVTVGLGMSGARSREDQGLQVDTSLGLALGSISLGLSTLMRSAQYPTLESTLQRSEPESSPDEEQNWQAQDVGISTSTSLSLSWADAAWGRLGYSLGFNQFHGDKEATLLHTLSYGRKFGNVTMNLSFQAASDRDNRLFLSASLPLGRRASLSSQMQRYQGENNYTTTFSHNPSDLWGYSVGASHNQSQSRLNGSMRATTAYSQLSANGTLGNDNSRSMMFSASGAAAYAGGMFATSPYALSDTFGIVSVPGQSGVRVSAMGSGTTITNHFGNAAIPSMPVNKKTTIQLNTKNLPLNIRLSTTSFDVAVSRGTVITREIKAAVIKQLLLTIKMVNGQPAPAGASVLDQQGVLAGVIMGQGNLMLSNEQIDKSLFLRIPNQSDCRLRFKVPDYFDPDALYEEADAECH
ncbi:fimbrial biogenesis outer membrane usher protein [Serratia fonticola]|uniref:fimbria/pilus outer membrane usher protein n=1 Tax=Serratia fonticola TaxID=47917 RepID=UPI00192AF4E7|nr:fimbria/pilus outer membrane usher protein [Serratia fonticola]MBL5861739.1 fimbrial biogenesis outer membrane usher protein [Serratia fonticola]